MLGVVPSTTTRRRRTETRVEAPTAATQGDNSEVMGERCTLQAKAGRSGTGSSDPPRSSPMITGDEGERDGEAKD